jgi:hypothetical protein
MCHCWHYHELTILSTSAGKGLSRSSALFLHGLPIKSLSCLWPGKSLLLWCWFSDHVQTSSLAEHLGIPRACSEPGSGIVDGCRANLIARNATVPRHPDESYLIQACQRREGIQAFRHSASSSEVTFGLLNDLSTDWLSEKIRIRPSYVFTCTL